MPDDNLRTNALLDVRTLDAMTAVDHAAPGG
jgi:hypothetical protein